MTVPALIFDGKCGLCLRLAAWARRRLPRTVTIVPSQSPNALAYGLSPRETAASVYWIDARNHAWPKEQAVARSLMAMGGPWKVLGKAVALPGVSLVASLGYRLVAKNRHVLPGGTAACEVPTRAARRQDSE